MWGIGSITFAKEESDRLQNNLPDTLKSYSHCKRSSWFIFYLLLQFLVFVYFLYMLLIPDISFKTIEAIRKTLEHTPYRSEALECFKSAFICVQQTTNGEASIPENTFHSIQTIEDVFLWCYNVLAIYWQAGFLGNFNQNFYLNLRLVKQDASIVTDKHLKFFLFKQLGSQGTQNSVQSYERDFFRCEAEDANIREKLERLQKEDNWFTITTTEVHITLKLLNGFSMPWGLIHYSFLQMPTGRIVSKYNMDSLRLLSIYESNKVILVLMFCVICLVLLDTIKGCYNFFNIVAKNFKNCRMKRTNSNLKQPTMQSYFNNEKISFVVKTTRLLIVLIVIYQLFAYQIKGISTAWSAQKKKNIEFPENGLLFNCSVILRLLAFLYIVFKGCQIYQELTRVQSDFCILYYHTAYFLTRFYPFIVLSFFLIICTAFHLHLIVRNSYDQSSTLPYWFIWIFQQFLGINSIEFRNQTYPILVITITILIYYFFLFPFGLSMTYFSVTNILRERETDPYYRSKENWIRRIWKTAWRHHLFFFCHNPIDVMKSNKVTFNQVTDVVKMRSDIQVYVERKWEKRVFYIYLVFYILFLSAAAIMLNEQKQYQYHQLMNSFILHSSMKKDFQLPIIPYMTENENILPNRPVNFNTPVIGTTSLKNLFHITDLKHWINRIMIMKVMNEEFQNLRHTVPLCNPISVVFLMSKMEPNKNNFFSSLWPQTTTTNVVLSPDKIFSQKKKLQSIYQFSRSLVKIRRSLYNPIFHHIFLSYGDVSTLIHQFNEAASKYNLINGALRIIQIEWAEYNMNSGTIISYILQMSIDTSGVITCNLDTSVFQRKASSTITIGFNTILIQFFCNKTFYLMLLSWILFLFYYASILYLWITRRLIYTRFQKSLDILQCVMGVYFILSLSGVMSPSLFISMNEQKNYEHYDSGQTDLQIFSFRHAADEARTIQILSQIKNFIRYRRLIFYAISLTICIGICRLVILLITLKRNFIYNFYLSLQNVRWKLLNLLLLFILIHLVFSISSFLCWGHVAWVFSTWSSAIKAVCFFSIFKGHVIHTPDHEPITNLLLQMSLFLFICFNIVICHSLVICIIYDGSRHQSIKKKPMTDTFNETNVSTPNVQNIMLTCNDQVITLCQTIISFIKTPLSNQNQPEGTKVNETISKVFSLLQYNVIMSYAPENSSKFIMRNLYIKKINNIQLLFTYIMILQCKIKLISIDTSRLKEKTQKSKSRQKNNQVYISILNNKIKKLLREIESCQNFKRLQKSELLPDIIHVRKSSNIENTQRIDQDGLKEAQARLKRERKDLKKSKHKKSVVNVNRNFS